MAALLYGLRDAGAQEQTAALLARDPAAHVSLDNPRGVAWLHHARTARSGSSWCAWGTPNTAVTAWPMNFST